MASASGSGGGNNIKVVARFRPQNKIELSNGGEPIVKFDGNDTCSVNSTETNAPFTFDRVFDMTSQQSDIFEFSIRSTVEDVMNGYNGTVFAYGQTGAGKSYTMMGDMDDEQKKGIIPRITEQIFDSILVHGSAQIEYTVGISYMEIYMERIRDLLNPMNDNLPIHEGPRGPFVKGIREIYVNQVDEVYTAMHLGQRSRAVASTNMNLESSRSHSIFVVTISQKDINTGSQKSGTLYLVDLAGSEKVGKTGASGQTLEEAKKINKSLSALGMVINALTDGKSTHVPYRDSKLTRILQESLGGNSRTTLIINCSPSSYNDAETVSTLRFGMRAKSIKNKAKINAELSPAELKKQLKAAQNQAMSFEKYISSLDQELQLWRQGQTVPKENWVQPISGASAAPKTESKPRSDATSRLQADSARPETPSRSESRAGDRSSTPSIVLERDEREEFIRRENELQDQIAEKESQATSAERALLEAREELRSYKEGQLRTTKENEAMADKLNKTQMELQKLSFQSKDDAISMDGLKEANTELESELVAVKQQLLDLKMSAKETSAALDEKDRKKQEKMAKMLAGFDLGDHALSENDRRVQNILDQIDTLEKASTSEQPFPKEVLASLKAQLLESQASSHHEQMSIAGNAQMSADQDARRMELEDRLAQLEQDYEDLLTRNLTDSDVDEIKRKLEDLYGDRHETQHNLIDDLKSEVDEKVHEIMKLQKSLSDAQSQARPVPNGIAANGVTPRNLQQQISDFDLMKKNLMRDLQNRCERVVELEISLDETREQYNNVLRSSNNRQQQKKMAFLERNLDQLTVVQRQLVEQNTSLKKEVAIAERKLIARNERILSLEQLLGDSQEKLAQANHRFEAQLQAVKERLEAAKVSARNPTMASGTGVSGLGALGSRIAKPLRGGGGVATAANESVNGGGNSASVPYWSNLTGNGPSIPYFSNISGSGDGNSANNKRSSWFFQKSS